MPLLNSIAGLAQGPPDFYAPGVLFTASSSQYLYNTAFSGSPANTKQMTVSFWFYRRTVNPSRNDIFGSDNTDASDMFLIYTGSSSDRITCRGADTSNITNLEASASTQHQDTDWHHHIVSVDLSDTGKRHIYTDGVSDVLQFGTYDNTVMKFSGEGHTVGKSAASYLDGAIAEYYMTNEYIDLSVATNLARFISSQGKPVSLGANGSRPTGNQPIVYLSNPAADFHINHGYGGNYVQSGGPTDTTSPSD
jgi:hypothetical protein